MFVLYLFTVCFTVCGNDKVNSTTFVFYEMPDKNPVAVDSQRIAEDQIMPTKQPITAEYYPD